MAEIDRDVAGYPATVIKPPPPDPRIIILPGINLRLVTLVRAGLISPDRSRSSLGRWYHSSLINGGYPSGPPILRPSLSLSLSKWREVNHPISQRERIFLTFQGICMTISVRQSELWKGENKSKSMDGIKLVIIFDSREFKKSRDFP